MVRFAVVNIIKSSGVPPVLSTVPRQEQVPALVLAQVPAPPVVLVLAQVLVRVLVDVALPVGVVFWPVALPWLEGVVDRSFLGILVSPPVLGE